MLEHIYLGNSVKDWILFLSIAIALSLALNILNRLTIKKLKRYVDLTHNDIDDMLVNLLDKTSTILIIVFSVYIGSLFLQLNQTLLSIRKTAVITAIFLQIALWGSGLITYIVNKKINRYSADTAGSTITQLRLIGFLARVALWTIVFLLIVDNLGFDITALITGLGIGGIAIALAVQNVLGDLIASLSIVLDQPFVVGDFIIVDNYMGTVENIGLKTTRIRSISGEQLIFSNNDLLNSRIKNYKRMYERRVVFTLGVVYETPASKLEKIPKWIEQIINNEPTARFDRSHFASYGDFSLNFETVYFVTSPDYKVYMDTQQNINLAIYRKFEEEGIEFAYPTRTIYLSHINNTSTSKNNSIRE